MPSRRERLWRWLMIAAVALAPWAGFVPLDYLLPAYGVFALQAMFLLRRHSSSAPIRVLQQTANGWRLSDEQGEIYLAELDGPVRDWPGLLCLSFKQRADDVLVCEDRGNVSSTGYKAYASGAIETSPRAVQRHWRLAIWQDQLSPKQWRRLRVNVLWRRRKVPKSYLQPAPSALDNPACNAGHATHDAPKRYE